jgi:uncharacterized protein
VLRVVVDPGVLVSAVLAAAGRPAEIVERWRDGEFDLVVSPKLLEELAGVLLRQKFRDAVEEVDAHSYVALLRHEAIVVDDPDGPPAVSRDPDDDYLVALGREAGAFAIVSGDAHLTELDIPDIRVLTPQQFLDELSERA